jgi:23S rRNA pseudouridine1911/1915/1917 synthase
MSVIGHPLVGDRTYGGASTLLRERVFLHSYLLGLAHPINGRHLEVRSPLPAELVEVLEGLRRSRDGSDLIDSSLKP